MRLQCGYMGYRGLHGGAGLQGGYVTLRNAVEVVQCLIVSFFCYHFPDERNSHVCNEPVLHLTLSILFNPGRSVSS